jgi:hypothetical protein
MGIKISGLNSASTLTGTELVPIVQDNVTVRTTAAAFKTTNAGDLVTGTVAIARLPVSNTSFPGIIQIGTISGTACEGNDGRLSDARIPSGLAGGDLTGTYPSPALTTTGVAALTYGSASRVGVLAVDAKGRITGGTSQPIAISTAQISGLAPSATSDTTNASNITSGTLKAISVGYLKETTTVQASAASTASPVVLNVVAQPTLYYTSNATGNWTLNITGNTGVTLDSLMSINQAITVTFVNTNGASAYYVPTASLQIDGSTSNRTVKWLNGLTFIGNSNSTDAWTFTVIKTASNTFTVLGNLTKFA